MIKNQRLDTWYMYLDAQAEKMNLNFKFDNFLLLKSIEYKCNSLEKGQQKGIKVTNTLGRYIN